MSRDNAAFDVRAEPSTPRAGSLFKLWIGASALAASERARIRHPDSQPVVRVAGEPLHFQTVGDTAWAMAAVPIDSVHGISVVFICSDASTIDVRIATSAGEYRTERLRVAPRFGAPPDSALAERMRQEAAQAAEVSRTSHVTPAMWTTTPFRAPRPTRITSGFGSGRMFNGVITSRHMGTDYAGAIGAPVVATNRGVVRLIGEFYLGGNVIYIDHGAGLVTAYLHLSDQLVAVGDTVQAGQPIGRVGATGRVTGPHLHFIARYGAITVDPASLRMQTPAKALERARGGRSSKKPRDR